MEEIILLIDFDVEFTQKQGTTGNYVQLSKAFKKTIFADLHKFQTNVETVLSSAEYDTVLAAIKNNEDDICRDTRD